jgi:hypothetical protein
MKRSIITVIDNKGEITVEYKGKKMKCSKYLEFEKQATIVDKKYIDAWLNKKSRKVSKYHPWR